MLKKEAIHKRLTVFIPGTCEYASAFLTSRFMLYAGKGFTVVPELLIQLL